MNVALVVPFKDEIVSAYRGKAIIVEGPEEDVLSRYWLAAEKLNADYVVRITADCPLLPSYLITKHIKVAIINNFDYCSNVHEQFRTAIDGFDVEVVSRRALKWANETAVAPDEREHVTKILRGDKVPSDFTIGHIIGQLNQAHLKLSVDSPEDLTRVREEYHKVKEAIKAAEKAYGKGAIHRV
jgi:spore coat polysaccharide biosynthesis protein SpsF